jgi:hypothetical protein
VIGWCLQGISHAKPANNKLVDFKPSDSRTINCESTNGEGSNGQGAKC